MINFALGFATCVLLLAIIYALTTHAKPNECYDCGLLMSVDQHPYFYTEMEGQLEVNRLICVKCHRKRLKELHDLKTNSPGHC